MLLDEDTVSVDDLMKCLHLSRRSIYMWIEAKKLPKPFKLGHKLLWKKSEIEEYLEKSRKS